MKTTPKSSFSICSAIAVSLILAVPASGASFDDSPSTFSAVQAPADKAVLLRANEDPDQFPQLKNLSRSVERQREALLLEASFLDAYQAHNRVLGISIVGSDRGPETNIWLENNGRMERITENDSGSRSNDDIDFFRAFEGMTPLAPLPENIVDFSEAVRLARKSTCVGDIREAMLTQNRTRLPNSREFETEAFWLIECVDRTGHITTPVISGESRNFFKLAWFADPVYGAAYHRTVLPEFRVAGLEAPFVEKVSGAPLSPQELYERARRSSYTVSTSTQYQNTRTSTQGSAVAVGRHTLLTNCHVVMRRLGEDAPFNRRNPGFPAGAPRDKIVIVDAEEKFQYAAHVKQSWCNFDIAMLEVDAELVPVEGIRTFRGIDLNRHERGYAVGSPGEYRARFTFGTMFPNTGRRPADQKIPDEIIVSALTSPGSSGGGLFDCFGNLVGLTTAVAEGHVGPFFETITIAVDNIVPR
jgi:S1-C subfamily serine protease